MGGSFACRRLVTIRTAAREKVIGDILNARDRAAHKNTQILTRPLQLRDRHIQRRQWAPNIVGNVCGQRSYRRIPVPPDRIAQQSVGTIHQAIVRGDKVLHFR